MKPVVRRAGTAVIAGVALVLAASCTAGTTDAGAANAGAKGPVIRIAVGVDPSYAPLYLAVERGMFAKAGVNVQLMQVEGGPAAAEAVVAGTAQISANATRVRLFRFSAVSWNSHRIHYDQEHARAEGFPDVVVQSTLHGEMFARTVLRWAGPGAVLRRVEWRNRAIAYADVPLTCSATVGTVREEGDGHVVELALTETAADGTVEVHIP